MSGDSIEPEPAEWPINGELDLHAFRPAEIAELLDAYVDACLERGIRDLRIVHGKGIGTLRRTVEAWLRKDPRVATFSPGGASSGSWGATLVRLK